MTAEEEIVICLSSVELEHLNVLATLAGEVLATVTELNFLAVLDLDVLEGFQVVAQNVHHLHTISKANHDVEA